jgi:hypothetical protein
MKAKKTLTIEVEMFSDASEASLHEHLNNFIEELQTKCESMKWQSWHKSVNVGWDESYPVDIGISIK